MEILTNLLLSMLGCFEDEDYETKYWKRVTGYGLRASDFENFDGCSRRIFSRWRNYLLERRLIKIPRLKKGKLNENSNRFPYNTQFAISSLGICYLSSKLDKIDLYYWKKIIKFFSFYSSLHLAKNWEKICEIIGEKEAFQTLKKVLDTIDISETPHEIQVRISYKTKGRRTFEFFKYKIKEDKVRLELPEDEYTDESYKIGIPVSDPIVDQEILFTDVAEFVEKAFCYALVEDCHWKIKKISNTLKWATLKSKEKKNFENTITKCKTILETLPFEIHLTAYYFIGENIFGGIRGEESLARQIFNYFVKDFAPKFDFNLTGKDGEPLQLFPEN